MNIHVLKEKLLDEKKTLYIEIYALGGVIAGDGNFQALADKGTDVAENIELANMFEVQETKDAILDQLENRLLDVELALKKIDAGNYGLCESTGKQIEEARLLANPAARTCLAHKNDVLDRE